MPFQGQNYHLLHSLGMDPPGDVSGRFVVSSLSIEGEVKKTTCAENHTCHEKQTECLPVPYWAQSENLWHGNVPEILKKRRHKENHDDRETDESQRHHANLLAV
jgi:hypothetical protein